MHDAPGGGIEDKAKGLNCDHDHEALSAAPDIKDLGDRQSEYTSDDRRHNARNRNQVRSFEISVSIGRQWTADAALESDDEICDENPSRVSMEMAVWHKNKQTMRMYNTMQSESMSV